MKNKIYLVAVALAATAMFTGCAKDGATGPQGPPGIDGNANVIGTNSVTITWAFNSINYTYTDTILASGITQDIVDKGLVEVYINYGSEWWVLPDIIGVNSTSYGFGVGYVSLINSNSNGTIPSYPASSTFRVVIISSSNRLANPNVNWRNYKEVKAALHLQD